MLRHISDNFKEYLTAFSGVLAVAGALASLGAKTMSIWWSKRAGASIKTPDGTITIEGNTEEEQAAMAEAFREEYAKGRGVSKAARTRDAALPTLITRKLVVVRINEAIKARTEQLGTAKWSKVSSNSLIIAQYIIGGVLASSFIQESLNPKWIGAMGVVVLIASLFRQQFHPEINAQNASTKASKLKALIRNSEDQLAIIDARIASGEDHSDAMIALLTQIRERLSAIEDPEAIESKPAVLNK